MPSYPEYYRLTIYFGWNNKNKRKTVNNLFRLQTQKRYPRPCLYEETMGQKTTNRLDCSIASMPPLSDYASCRSLVSISLIHSGTSVQTDLSLNWLVWSLWLWSHDCPVPVVHISQVILYCKYSRLHAILWIIMPVPFFIISNVPSFRKCHGTSQSACLVWSLIVPFSTKLTL